MRPNPAAIEKFGLNTLRPAQVPIIEASLAGENILAVLPTGGGKSLCYQLPAIETRGITIVISPLLALMRDQIQTLRSKDLPAFHISSAQSDDENHQNLAALRKAKNGLFYISPEQLSKTSTQYWLNSLQLARLVIDEAHCFSEWGHDFRPDYREIPSFLAKRSELPVSAFTATATPKVLEDLAQNLFGKRGFQRFVHPPRRENIEISFLRKTQPRQQLLDLLTREPTIIYAATRAKTEVLAQAIREAGFKATHYHAGLESDERRRIEANFLNGKMPMIVATNAFGMGVDHPSIRQIIHADMPASLEAYVQEIGRAGRDGKPARAVALFGEYDYDIRREQIEHSIDDDARRAQKIYLLDQLFAHAEQGGDWGAIEAYFAGETTTPPDIEANNDPLSALKRWRYAQAQRQKIPPYWVLPDQILTDIATASPQNLDALARISGMGETRLAKYGQEILTALGITPTPTNRARRNLALRGKGQLFETLQALALQLRHGENGTEKPMDCPNALLKRIAESEPRDHNSLAKIRGMNEERLARFGDAFLLALEKNSL